MQEVLILAMMGLRRAGRLLAGHLPIVGARGRRITGREPEPDTGRSIQPDTKDA